MKTKQKIIILRKLAEQIKKQEARADSSATKIAQMKMEQSKIIASIKGSDLELYSELIKKYQR